MRKLKWVYICNLCGSVTLPEDGVDNMGESCKMLPDEWEQRGRSHLCPDCLKVLEKCPHWRAEYD